MMLAFERENAPINKRWNTESEFRGSQISCCLTGRFVASTYLEFPFFFFEAAPEEVGVGGEDLPCSKWPLEAGVAMVNYYALNSRFYRQ